MVSVQSFADTIPLELRTRHQWVVWRLEKRKSKTTGKDVVTKVPHNPHTGTEASSTDPETWGTFNQACTAVDLFTMSGIGFVFTESDPYTGVDLDKVINLETGDIEPRARDVIDQLNSYTELSQSGAGVHTIVKAKLPLGGRKKAQVEMYDTGRYFVMTGRHFPETPTVIESRQPEIETLHREIFGAPKAKDKRKRASEPIDLDDQQLLDVMFRAENGGKIAALWRGDTSGYGSHSEADFALLGYLASYTNCDHLRMERMFCQSGLYRENSKHEGYLPRSIEKATVECSWFYHPHYRKNGSSKRHERRETQAPHPNGDPPGDEPKLELQLTNDGRVRETLFNYMEIYAEHAYWRGRLRLNTFAGHVIELDGKAITDADEIEMGYWCANEFGIAGNNSKVRSSAILGVASRQGYDPLTEFVNSLPPWDRKGRLKQWLIDYCGAPTSDKLTIYSAWVGTMLIVQMIVRALKPGCVARYVVILEGPEAIGKSKLVLDLGDPWSQSFDLSMDTKEAHMAVQGCWVAELAELDSLSRSAETRIKSFISQTTDSYVPKYSNNRVDYLRRCVFIGTTNEDVYLTGQTGNTRFLPIQIKKVDREQIKKERLQLFAEAKAFYLEHGDDWWKPYEGLEAELAIQRDHRRVRSVYEKPLQDWLDGISAPPKPRKERYPSQGHYPIDEWGDEPQVLTRRDRVAWPDIAQNFLYIESPERWKDRALQMQIASALKAIGWERDRDKRSSFWVRNA